MTGKIQDAGNQKLVPQFYYGAFSESWPVAIHNMVDMFAHPHPDFPIIQRWSDAMADEAGVILYELRETLRPATGPELLGWLWPIAGSVRNPPAEDDFKRRVAGLELAATLVPHVAFNPLTQRLGLATWSFFPSVADIVELVSADVAPLMERVRALKVIAGVTDPAYMCG